MKTKEKQTYLSEIKQGLNSLEPFSSAYPEIDYFVNCIKDHLLETDKTENSKKIIVIGSSVPEDIIYASGVIPYWIHGGSYQKLENVDNLVPRDTDPVSQSNLGHVINEENSLIIIPLVNDSSRKLAYLLESNNKQVMPFSVPTDPITSSGYNNQEYRRSIKELKQVVSRYTKKIITKGKIKKARQSIHKAYDLIRTFDRLADQATGLIPGICRMLVFFSYYCTANLNDWNTHLELLNNRLKLELENSSGIINSNPNILIVGSPVYFPNYKIPLLAEEIGFNILGCADYTNLKLLFSFTENDDYFDCSPAYSDNKNFRRAVRQLIERKNIDGIIFHVLKGQIEYDYELNDLENTFTSQNIPFIRIETDYNQQDIEQLRLRLEAFSEILRQNRL